MSVRKLCCGVIVAALGVAPAAAQGPAPTTTSTSQTAITQDETVLQGDTTPRPALPTTLWRHRLLVRPHRGNTPEQEDVVQRVQGQLGPATGNDRCQQHRDYRCCGAR